MDRASWLKHQRRIMMDQEDTIYAPIYDAYWGEIAPVHGRFLSRFLALCPPQACILDAACGTGKYWQRILETGKTVFGVDHSEGMLSQARNKHPTVPYLRVGLQEIGFHEEFEGAICIDALEMIPPEDWPLVLGNIHRALKPHSYLYFTVEIAEEEELARAFNDARKAGLPVVYGEWAYESGFHGDWAQDGGYHYYPRTGQVKAWLYDARFLLVDQAFEVEYHHFLVQKLA